MTQDFFYLYGFKNAPTSHDHAVNELVLYFLLCFLGFCLVLPIVYALLFSA